MANDLSSLLNRGALTEGERKPEGRGWQISRVPTLAGGINDRVAPDLINDTETPICENLSIQGGRVRIDTGYKQFASTFVDGPMKGVFDHRDSTGTVTTIAVTDNTVYKYNSSEDEWQIIKGDVDTTVAVGGMDALDTDCDVNDDTGFVVNDWVGITLTDGTQHVAKLTAVSGGGNIEFLGHAAPSAAAAGNAVVRGAQLSGDNDNQIVFQPIPFHEVTVFTNGVDVPYAYDSGDDDVLVVANLPNSGNTVCKTLALYRDALFLLNVNDGSEAPYKYYWSSPGTFETWSGSNAGNNSLLDSTDEIIAAAPIGPSLAIYRNNSIVRVDYRGALGAIFSAITTVYGEDHKSQPVGAVSPNAIFPLPDEHVVLAKDGLYLYRGGFNTQLVSSNVFESTFSQSGDFSVTTAHRAFLTFMDRTNELFCFYPSTSATTFSDRSLVWSVEDRTFRKRIWAEDEITCSGLHAGTGSGVAIDDLIGTIDEQTWILSGGSAEGSISTPILGLYTTKKSVNYDYFSPNDDGTDIDWQIHTKDFDGKDRSLLHQYAEIYAGATDFNIWYSTDSGATENLLGTFSNDTQIIPRRYYRQFTARKWRYIIRGTGGGSEIGKLSFRYKETSPTF